QPLRRDHERAAGAERAAQLHQPESVRDAEPERPHRELAAHVRAKRVVKIPEAPPLDPLQHEPGTAAQRVRHGVLGQQQAGGQLRDVLDPQVHVHGLARGHPGGADLAPAAEPVTGPAGGSSRWASTGTASAWTSSGMTKSRPSRAAYARQARSRCSVARGEAPSRSSWLDRVAFTRLIT